MPSKTVLLGVTGSIAAYKAAQLCSNLCKKGYEVHVIMTRNACELVAPQTFQTLSGNRVSVETFDRGFEWNVEHVALAKRAGAFLVAPATANCIAKMAHGIADDMLTTTLLAARCPVVVCPAMNTAMFDHPATQENMEILRRRGVLFVDAESGRLACGDNGRGRFAAYSRIEEAVEAALETEKPLAGKRVLVTAGATQEALDPVRYITNHSTGRMGYAVARAARRLGAGGVLAAAPGALPDPWGVRVRHTVSAREMFDAVREELPEADYVVMAAAVADYRPAEVAAQKIKKADGALSLSLERTDDILLWLGQNRREGQKICGFSMETENLIENSREKLRKKNCDLLVANSLSTPGAGFAVDTNVASLITAGGVEELPLMSKDALASEILCRLAAL